MSKFQVCNLDDLGPVVQSIVSLTSSLRVISLTVLADSIHNILKFFAEKMWVAFALQKLLTFFSKKFQRICVSLDVNFNESLTNDVVSFEKLGPGGDSITYKLMDTQTHGWTGKLTRSSTFFYVNIKDFFYSFLFLFVSLWEHMLYHIRMMMI